jgi:alpha-D-xyloside xylohydrolase
LKIIKSNGGVEIEARDQVVRIEPWGRDALRVRAGVGRVVDGLPGALDIDPEVADWSVDSGEDQLAIATGAITALVADEVDDGGHQVMIRFVRTDDRSELLAEQRSHFWWPGARVFHSLGGSRYRLEQHFTAYEDERLFGLGQRTHGRLDQKGMALDLVQRNAEVSIPFVLSSRGYGLLWNNPAVGHVELAANRTRWVAEAGRQIDYWITVGEPAEILTRYAEVTGRVPQLPAWASGFWQSKLRYRTQEELLEVAREYHTRGLPLAVIVADFFHWTALGDWKFDPAEWPDPRAMVDELEAMGTKLMVSVWPLVSPLSENHEEMRQSDYLVGAERGPAYHTEFPEKGLARDVPVGLHDPTNPEARRFVWSKIRENYYAHGVRVWWLDACEPELRPTDPANLRFHIGTGDEVVNLYPLMQARGFYEGMLSEGEDEVVLLCRSAWAGSQRYGAAVWSGDIPATWDSLRQQVRAGLNIAISGIPWWTSDIGGFHGGDPSDPDYRELIVRWFQYGAFCPLFRLHGDRLPRLPLATDKSGGPNEAWSYGVEAYDLICQVLRLRERIRPYVDEQMNNAHTTGLPPMRPLFVDFPDDTASWNVEDEFMFGSDLLVAPIVAPGVREREVYLPPGVWAEAWSGVERHGGTTILADAPLDRIPVFLRDGADTTIGRLIAEPERWNSL